MGTQTTIIELDGKVDKLLEAQGKATKGMLTLGGATQKSQKTITALGNSAKKSISSVASSVKKGVYSILALKAAMIATSMAAAAMGKEIKTSAQLAGTSVEEMQLLSNATGTVGISMEKLGDISKDTREKIGDFLNTGGGGFQDFADSLNLTKQQALKLAKEFNTLSGPDVLQRMVTMMEDGGVSANQMSHALEGMASDTTNLIPLLRNGGEVINKLKKDFNDTNVVLTETDITKLGELSKGFSSLKDNFDATMGKFSVEYADQINSITKTTREGLKIVGDEFASGSFTDRLNSFYNAFTSSWSTAFSDNIDISQDFSKDFNNEITKLSEFWLDFSLTLPISLKKGMLSAVNIFYTMIDVIVIKIAEANILMQKGLKLLHINNELPLAEKTLSLIKDGIKARQDGYNDNMANLQAEKERILKNFDAEQKAADEKRIKYAEDSQTRIDIAKQEAEEKLKILNGVSSKKDNSGKTKNKNKKRSKAELDEDKKLQQGKAENITNYAKIAEIANTKLFNDNKAIKAGLIIANTAAAVMNQMAGGDPYTAFSRAAAAAAMGVLQLANLSSSSPGGGSISGGNGGNQSTQQAPQKQIKDENLASIDVSYGDQNGYTQQTVKFATDSGDDLIDAIAAALNKGQKDGRF